MGTCTAEVVTGEVADLERVKLAVAPATYMALGPKLVLTVIGDQV